MRDVLLVGNPKAEAKDIQGEISLLSETQQVSFEQLDRISFLKMEQFKSIHSGRLKPKAFHHSPAVLSQFAKCLVASGSLTLTEPVMEDTANLMLLQSLNSSSKFIPCHSEKSLLAELVMNGFVGSKVVERSLVTRDTISDWISNIWGVAEEEQSALLACLEGHLFLVTINSSRPNYVLGKSAKLSFAKKKASEPKQYVKQDLKPIVWSVSAMDDDIELENEDELLDEEDLVVPPTAPDGDCSTKRKACKDCSCGRAEEEEEQLMALITLVEPKKVVTSSCGSCFLGDAYRCGSCPYLGMPAFKPGEEVKLAGNLLNDDLAVE